MPGTSSIRVVPTLLTSRIRTRFNLGRGNNCRQDIYRDSCLSSDNRPHLLFRKVDHAHFPDPYWPSSLNHYNLRGIMVNEKVSITEQKPSDGLLLKNQRVAKLIKFSFFIFLESKRVFFYKGLL